MFSLHCMFIAFLNKNTIPHNGGTTFNWTAHSLWTLQADRCVSLGKPLVNLPMHFLLIGWGFFVSNILIILPRPIMHPWVHDRNMRAPPSVDEVRRFMVHVMSWQKVAAPYQDLLWGTGKHCVAISAVESWHWSWNSSRQLISSCYKALKNQPRKSWVHRNLYIGSDIVIVSVVGLSGCRLNGNLFCLAYQKHRWSMLSFEHGVVCQENPLVFRCFEFPRIRLIPSTILDWRTPWSRHCFVQVGIGRKAVTQRLYQWLFVVSNMFKWPNCIFRLIIHI